MRPPAMALQAMRSSTPKNSKNCWKKPRVEACNGCAVFSTVSLLMSAIGPKRTSLVAPHMSAFGGKADMTFVVANSKIKVQNFRALFWARSLNRFFQRAFPLLRLLIFSVFQCRVRYAKFTMLQTSKPYAVKGAGLNLLCLRFANWTCHHRQFP